MPEAHDKLVDLPKLFNYKGNNNSVRNKVYVIS